MDARSTGASVGVRFRVLCQTFLASVRDAPDRPLPSSTRNTRWLRRAALAAIPVVLLLVVAELILRSGSGAALSAEAWEATTRIHRKSQDPELVYEYVPGGRSDFGEHSIAINAAGFRDDEFPDPPPADAKRIVLLGDSVASGWGVAMEDAFPQRLEAQLGGDAVVYNLAVNGYSTAQQLRLFETRGLALRPDLVIVTYMLNDPDVLDGGLGRYFSPRFELLHLARRAIRSVSESAQGLPSEYHQRVHARHFDETAGRFARFGELAREHDVRILVAVVPVFEQGSVAASAYRWQNIHEDIAKLCKGNGLAFLDLRPDLTQSDPEAGPLAIDVWHPSKHGHALIAASLERWVREHGGD